MRNKILACIMLNVCLMAVLAVSVYGTQTIRVIGEVSEPIDGLGTEEKPYRYLIDEDSKVAWKRLIDNHQDGITEVYEYREGHTVDGDLRYSYTFRPEDISSKASGPYFLAIRIYDEEAVKGLPGYPDAMFFSFATKRDFPGKVEVALNVGDRFSDGTQIDITYYGGYDATVIHGAAPVVARDEIRQAESNIVQIAKGVMVENGMITFHVRHGGNYVLHEEPVDFSGFGISEVIHHDVDKVLGSIRSVFPTERIAETIASALGKETADTITQGDIDSIKSLYLSSVNLGSTKELERVVFLRLESLTLSENELESLNSLSMPSLTYLDVSGNRLKSVNALAKLDALEHVNLSNNGLISLPDLNGLTNLQTLDLSHNHLEIIPDLKSGSLRYLDLSSNAVTWVAGGLEQCPSLEVLDMTGQVFNTEFQIDVDEGFYLEPSPRFISQFGNGGMVIVTNSHGKKIYEEDFSVLESNDFFLDGEWFDKDGEYTVTVTGTVLQEGSEENLGTYTYKVMAGTGKAVLSNRKIIAFGIVIIMLGLGIGLALHAKKQKKEMRRKYESI